MRDARTEIKCTIDDTLNGKLEPRVALDKIIVLFEGDQSGTSDHFKKVVKDLDENYARVNDFRLALFRLSGILDAETIVNTSKAATRDRSIELHPTFEVEGEEKERMLKLCTDIRKIVTSSVDFDHAH